MQHEPLCGRRRNGIRRLLPWEHGACGQGNRIVMVKTNHETRLQRLKQIFHQLPIVITRGKDIGQLRYASNEIPVRLILRWDDGPGKAKQRS